MNDPDEVAQMVERLRAYAKEAMTVEALLSCENWRSEAIAKDAAALLERLQRELTEAKQKGNAPCADALDNLWRDVVLKHKPDYGEWEYPGQAYRHLLAEFAALRARLEAAEALLRDNKPHVHPYFRAKIEPFLAQRPAAEEQGT